MNLLSSSSPSLISRFAKHYCHLVFNFHNRFISSVVNGGLDLNVLPAPRTGLF